MAIWGLTAADYDDGAPEVGGETVWVWPDNAQALNVFVSLGTQWRVGFSGAYGLDYGVLYHKLDRMGLTPDDYERLEDEIRVLEGAALDAMREE